MTYSLILALIRYRIWVLVFVVVWAGTGIVILFNTPIDALPDLSENQVIVYAEWPNHDPPEIEQSITRPLSQAMGGIPGVRTVRGSSDVGFSLLHLIFEDQLSFSESRRRAIARLQEIKLDLPTGVEPRLAADGLPIGQILWYVVEGSNADLAELRAIQDSRIAPQLSTIPGVAEVASVGGFLAEYHVEADLDLLAKAGIQLSELEAGIRTLAPTLDKPSSQQTVDDPSSVRLDGLHRLETSEVQFPDGRRRRLGDLSHVSLGAAPRRGVFEKDGNEAVAGIVHMRFGANPLQVTKRVLRELQRIEDSLPPGIRLVPCYDRTALIGGAIGTVTRTLVESLLVTTLVVFLIMRHWRTSLVISLTLPLAILGAFIGMFVMGEFGSVQIQSNIMSLAGIAISIGVLVDSSIVVAENVSFRLKQAFGDKPVTGDVSKIVASASAEVVRPAFFAVLIMIVSFLPVFALQGIDGRMYQPLAWTKTLTLLSVAFLTVLVVPVFSSIFIRGKLRKESDSRLIRSIVGIYKPCLSYLIDRPLPLFVFIGVVLILGSAAAGIEWLVRLTTASTVGIAIYFSSTRSTQIVLSSLLLLLGLTASILIVPIRLALRLPLDEGMVMDMPITVPRISVAQAIDDLKARNMILCRFPEIAMVTGKAGRADTPFDPAPLDMIESMVEFQSHALWPRRRLRVADAKAHAMAVLKALVQAKLIELPTDELSLIREVVDAGLMHFDAIQRETCWQLRQSFQSELSRELALQIAIDLNRRLIGQRALERPMTGVDLREIASQLSHSNQLRLAQRLDSSVVHSIVIEMKKLLGVRNRLQSKPNLESESAAIGIRARNAFRATLGLEPITLDEALLSRLKPIEDRHAHAFTTRQNAILYARSAGTWTQIVLNEIFKRQAIIDESLAQSRDQVLAARYAVNDSQQRHGEIHSGMPSVSNLAIIDPHPKFDLIIRTLTESFSKSIWLWPHESDSLAAEMDLSVQFPGWANVWTKPIQNRIDMLATGVNSEVGIRVLGPNLDDVVNTSEVIADLLQDLSGTVGVLADPIRDKNYVDMVVQPDRMLEYGIDSDDVDHLFETATRGQTFEGPQLKSGMLPIRLLILPTRRMNNSGLMEIPVPCHRSMLDDVQDSGKPFETVPLSTVAQLRQKDGPATIKSENGSIRNFVRLNVRDLDPVEFVEHAKSVVERWVQLPPGVRLEWTGQYEHATRTRSAMLWIVPISASLIGLLLWATFFDIADAGLMFISIPGALSGGVLCQWILGFPFSAAVGVGYIACFGMAAATSMIMLVYLRASVAGAGGLERLTLPELRTAVINGAVHRLRPKLLTEATIIFGLAPILWSTGIGADIISPMAAPVLGGILIADEVVDLLLPIVFFGIRRRRWQRYHSSNS